MLRVPSRWCRSSPSQLTITAHPPGFLGSWLCRALETSRGAAQSPLEGCGATARPSRNRRFCRFERPGQLQYALQTLSAAALASAPAAITLLPTEESVAKDRAEDRGKLDDLVAEELAATRERQRKDVEDGEAERRKKQVIAMCMASCTMHSLCPNPAYFF